MATITDPEALENLKNLQLQQKLFPSPIRFLRYKSLLRNIGQSAKGQVNHASKTSHCISLFIILILLLAVTASAEPLPLPNISLNIGGNADQGKASTVVQLLFILTVLSLAPAILTDAHFLHHGLSSYFPS